MLILINNRMILIYIAEKCLKIHGFRKLVRQVSLCRQVSVNSVISGKVPILTGGPQYPVPWLT